MDYEKLMQDARKKISKITFNSEVEILKAYRVASFIIMKKIKENQKRGLEVEYYQNVNDELEEVVSILNNRLSDSIKKSIISVSDVITDVQLIFNSEVFPVNIAETANNYIKGRNMRLVQTLISGEYYKDSKSLDTRIWNITNKNKNDIQTLIASNIAKGVNSRELAKVIDNYVNPTTRTQAKTVVSGMSRNISYQAQRLARTSITQTANEANRESAKENVFCQGLKWNLSSSHYERQIKRWGPDICDVYANQNNYNLGQGVFPIEEYPISHPNCLCYSTQVQPNLDDIIARVNNWVDGGEDEELEKGYQKWKAGDETHINTNNSIKSGSSSKEKSSEEKHYTELYKQLHKKDSTEAARIVRDNNQFEKYKSLGYDGVQTFEKFQDIKYNNTKEWDMVKGYVGIVQKGEISPLVGYNNFKEYHKKLEKKLTGLKFNDGLEVKGISYHFTSRAIGTHDWANLSNSKETMKRLNHKHVPDYDLIKCIEKGNVFKKTNASTVFYFDRCQVTINQHTGNLIQCNRL